MWGIARYRMKATLSLGNSGSLPEIHVIQYLNFWVPESAFQCNCTLSDQRKKLSKRVAPINTNLCHMYVLSVMNMFVFIEKINWETK